MAKWIEACCAAGLLLAANGCSIVDAKYYDRLVRNGAGGGQDEDSGADADSGIATDVDADSDIRAAISGE